ncbi:secreted antigen 3 [Thermus thermophilus]|nr:secreted antigen 3 [Thermus thermophilus]
MEALEAEEGFPIAGVQGLPKGPLQRSEVDLPKLGGKARGKPRELRRPPRPQEVRAEGGKGGKRPPEPPRLGLPLRREGEVRPAEKPSLPVP